MISPTVRFTNAAPAYVVRVLIGSVLKAYIPLRIAIGCVVFLTSLISMVPDPGIEGKVVLVLN
jgi:hypothetical protein